MKYEIIIKPVRAWVESVVVGLNLCPFAKRELVKNRIRFHVADAASSEELLKAIEAELELLSSDPDIETTLLIHPWVLREFHDYNQFLNSADGLLEELELDGIYQIASFHPDYQFEGTKPDDIENYTNRSPYPMLHLIREDSLERAVANYPNAELIPERNIELLESMGREKMQGMLEACFHAALRKHG